MLCLVCSAIKEATLTPAPLRVLDAPLVLIPPPMEPECAQNAQRGSIPPLNKLSVKITVRLVVLVISL